MRMGIGILATRIYHDWISLILNSEAYYNLTKIVGDTCINLVLNLTKVVDIGYWVFFMHLWTLRCMLLGPPALPNVKS